MISFKSYLQENDYASKTIKSNEQIIYRFLDWLEVEEKGLEIEQVSYRDVLAYIKYLQGKRVQQASIRNYVKAIELFYDYQKELGKAELNTTNPAKGITIKGIRSKKLYHVFSLEELNGLYTNFNPKAGGFNEQVIYQRKLTNQRNKVMLGLYVYQGIQTSELARLLVQDINLREGKVRIPQTKNSNERELELKAVQILDLMEYLTKTRKEILKISRQENESLLVSPRGGNVVNDYVKGMLKQLREQNKAVRKMHQIRTSVIVQWLRQCNLREAQYRAGHKHISSTEKYKANDMESLLDDINRFHPQN